MTGEQTESNRLPAEEREVARLLALAGPRPLPPADVEARIRAATLAAFEALPDPAPRVRVRSLRFAPLTRWALAASLLLALSLGWLVTRQQVPAPAGAIRFATGGYTVRGSGEGSTVLLPGSILRTSAEGRVLIDLGGHRTVRVDQSSSLTLSSDSEIWLHDGRIYVDAAGPEGLMVVTSNASITDLGTQFEVAAHGERLDVATREGMVEVEVGDQRIRSRSSAGWGEALVIDGLTLVETTRLPTTGERWAWTQASRPPFSVSGRSVREFLDWAARESGRTLVFATPLAEQQASLRRLGGSGLVDADAASVARLLAATAFELRTGAEHELVIDLSPPRS